ncbi:MAG: DUF2911 domain-containing protein, partial [Bacteroidota bacterium]
TAGAQHNHSGTHASGDPAEVAETFVVDGLRVDLDELPGGSAVGRAGLRYGDGGYVAVVHGKPYVRGRQVWGGLVGLDQVWVAGAHRATEMITTVPLQIGDTRIEPGAYSLFVTPRNDVWTLHVNRAMGMHLADEYDADLDIATVTASPAVIDSERGTEPTVEGLTWTFTGDGAGLALAWDRLRTTFPIARVP